VIIGCSLHAVSDDDTHYRDTLLEYYEARLPSILKSTQYDSQTKESRSDVPETDIHLTYLTDKKLKG
jgi:hypothetical protein